MLGYLTALARPYGVTVQHKGSGHFHLQGKLLVNYYPLSKQRTAYVNGTIRGFKGKDHLDAILLTQEAPPVLDTAKQDKRSKKSRKRRAALFKRTNCCYWCGVILTLDSSTLDHVIPLSRGGLDGLNNIVLACEPCNIKRGNSMPELTGELSFDKAH